MSTTKPEIWMRLMVLPLTMVSLSAMALVTPPPTLALTGRPANSRSASAVTASVRAFMAAKLSVLRKMVMTAFWKSRIDQTAQVLLAAAHGVEQQVLRDALDRVGQLAGRGVLHRAVEQLEHVDDRLDLADGQRLLGDEVAQRLHALARTFGFLMASGALPSISTWITRVPVSRESAMRKA